MLKGFYCIFNEAIRGYEAYNIMMSYTFAIVTD